MREYPYRRYICILTIAMIIAASLSFVARAESEGSDSIFDAIEKAGNLIGTDTQTQNTGEEKSGDSSDIFDAISGSGNLLGGDTGKPADKDVSKDKDEKDSGEKPAAKTGKFIIDENYVDNEPVRLSINVEPSYKSTLEKWERSGINDYKGSDIVLSPALLADVPSDFVLPKEDSKGYDENVLLLSDKKQGYDFTFTAAEDALYTMKIDYYAIPDIPNPVEFGIKINDEYQFFESKRVLLEKFWITGDASTESAILNPEQDVAWRTTYLKDSSFMVKGPLKIHIKKGENKISLVPLMGSALIGKITLCAPKKLQTYEEYRSARDGMLRNIETIVIEAENPTYRTATSVMPGSDSDPSVVPRQSGRFSLPNILGGKTWKTGGHGAIWKFNVPEAGYYHLTIKYLNNYKVNMPVFRTITINGEVPFDAMEAYPFPYSMQWRNETLSDKDGRPYEIWLNAGENTIGLTATAAPYDDYIKRLEKLAKKINGLYLEIKMATGNSKDKNRDWDIAAQIPDLLNKLNYYAKELEAIYKGLEEISGKKPDEVRNLLVSAEQLRKMLENPGKIPVRYEILSEDSGSILQMVADIITTLSNQELKLDRIYVHGDAPLPPAQVSFWEKLIHMLYSLFSSFFSDYYAVNEVEESENTIKVWVTRARQFINVGDQLTRSDFTKKTGIQVEYSILQDEGKLALAVAAGNTPDAAIGIARYLPYNLALRNALYDLKNFENYNEVIDRFAPGAVITYIFNKGCYALPETQNFYVLFYRKDILDSLGLEVPQTWDDVKMMLPTLQRNGMSFYIPLSHGSGLKYNTVTTPFLYQYGGKLFTPDGTATAIDSEECIEGMKLMTRLYTIYSIPLQVPSFYNKFRSGEIPLGISDFGTYVQLLTAAPEIAGSWSIAPSPGVRQEDGTIARWQTGTDQAMIIFRDSKKKDEVWKFFDWWTSADTQSRYGNIMYALYGHEYSWNTANLEAYSRLPWPEEHKKVVLEQWEWLLDVGRMPGDYMLEREISDAWNRIVFDGINERRAIDEAVININRELRRKLEEFGFMVDGKMVKSIDVPDIEDVRK